MSPRSQRERGVLHYIGLGLSIGLLGLVLGLAALLIVVPKIAGATPLTVLTQSMEPTLPPGTLVVVKPVQPADIRVGDVVTYQIRSGDPAVITHRVIAVSSASDGTFTFTFKGDNNDAADPPVIDEQIQGRVWYSLPYVGYVNTGMNGEARAWLVPALAVALFGYAAFMIISGALVSMRAKRLEQTPGDAAETASSPAPAADTEVPETGTLETETVGAAPVGAGSVGAGSVGVGEGSR